MAGFADYNLTGYRCNELTRDCTLLLSVRSVQRFIEISRSDAAPADTPPPAPAVSMAASTAWHLATHAASRDSRRATTARSGPARSKNSRHPAAPSRRQAIFAAAWSAHATAFCPPTTARGEARHRDRGGEYPRPRCPAPTPRRRAEISRGVGAG